MKTQIYNEIDLIGKVIKSINFTIINGTVLLFEDNCFAIIESYYDGDFINSKISYDKNWIERNIYEAKEFGLITEEEETNLEKIQIELQEKHSRERDLNEFKRLQKKLFPEENPKDDDFSNRIQTF